jgi:tetratricopeptide (TPR) repeat protein
MRFLLAVCVILSGMAAAEAAPEKRVALVIGNNAYNPLHALENPGLDAAQMARVLSERGFDTVSCDAKRPGCFDLTRDGLTAAIGQFAEKSKGADLAFVFYAGHGLGAPEGNVLVPVDARVDCERQQVERGVLVDEVLEALSGAKQKIIVLDACRNNPIGEICPPATKSKLSFRDFKIPDAGNFLLVSSTKPGQVADDGLPGAHSPFARALFAAFTETPNVHFHQVFDRVSKAVIEESAKGLFTQIPEMLIRGGAPEACLAGEACAADPRAAALATELDALKRDRARDQELGETAKEYLAQLEKQRGKPFSEDERRRELASLKDAARSLAARNDNRGERALERLKSGDTSEARRLFQEDLDAEEAEERAEEQRRAERRKKAAASARKIAALSRWTNVAEALTYYKRALTLDPDDANTWDDYAHAALDAGRTDDAKAAFEQAAAKASGENADRIRFWAINGRGDVLKAQGNLPDAFGAYRDALAIAERLAKTDPVDAGWQRTLGAAKNDIGGVLEAQGNLPDALEAYRDTLAIVERLAKAAPGDAQAQRDLCVSYDKVAGVQSLRGNLPDALQAYRDGLAIADRLAKADPSNAGAQLDLSMSYNSVGSVLAAQGKPRDALNAYRDALAIRERLASADPGNAEWQRDLAVSHGTIAINLEAQGDVEGALGGYRKAMEILERLTMADPGNAVWQRDLSVAYRGVGGVLKAQGKLTEAAQSYQAGLAISERLAKADPSNSIWLRDVSVSYEGLGRVQQAQGDMLSALKSYQAGLAISERLAKADPSNARWQRDLSVSYTEVGDVQEAQRNLADALTSYRNGLAIADRLAKSDPSNAEWQRDLSVSYTDIGGVLEAQGNLADALKAYRDSLAIHESLAGTDPSNAGWQRELASSHERVGRLLVKNGNKEEASAAYQRALGIYKDAIVRLNDPQARLNSVVPLWRLGGLKGAAGQPELQRGLAILTELRDAGKLDAKRIKWIPQIERERIEAIFSAGEFARAADEQAKLVAEIEKREREKAGEPGAETATALLSVSWYRIFAGDFEGSIAASERGVAIRPDWLPLATNKAHALMFLGRAEEARSVYQRYKGQRVEKDGNLWEQVIREDFQEFAKHGLKHAQIAEIEALLAAK